MANEILVNVTGTETRVAIVENDRLCELRVEREHQRSLVGNIYKGRVSKVLPGMQAAFVDYGETKAGFLHVSDMVADTDTEDAAKPNIAKLIRSGEEIIVQVIKEPINDKGARLSTQLTIPSRYLVLLPTQSHLGVSHRITDEDERERLSAILSEYCEEDGFGYIIRTAAVGVELEELLADRDHLLKVWAEIRNDLDSLRTGDLVRSDLPLLLQVVRDLGSLSTERMRIDSEDMYTKAKDYAEQNVPEVAGRLALYESSQPIFELYNIEKELQQALRSSVSLPSGGYIVIDQTEAMSTIDVNTGGYVGQDNNNAEKTLFKTNLEAVDVIARQIRLRNISGIIIVDFIDMLEEQHRDQVLERFTAALATDPVRSTVSPAISELGLVQLTRKRVYKSLRQILFQPCSTCHGQGYVKSMETVTYEVLRRLLAQAKTNAGAEFYITASQQVIDHLAQKSELMADLEEVLDKPIHYKAEDLYGPDQFDVVSK